MHSIDIKDLQLNALLEVTQAVNNNIPEADLFRIYRFTLLTDFRIQKLALYVQKNDDWECCVHFGSKTDFSSIALHSKYLKIVDEIKISENTDVFSEFDSAFPVMHKKKLLAILFISSSTLSVTKSHFLKALTNIILVAIENKRLVREQINQKLYQKELEIAKKVQNFLFPKILPNTEKIQIKASYLPHQDVGGDYYDYIKIDDNRFFLCIADVSGKGVPAAILMSNFQASIRALIRQTNNLTEIVNELNLIIRLSGNAEHFITFFALIYDYQKASLEYINCGHNEILLYHENEKKLLTEGTTIIGMLEKLPSVKTQYIKNIKKFLVFAYTDGLTETFNPQSEAFGLERLEEILTHQSQYKNLTELHNQIHKKINEFRKTRPFHDDITMLSCRVKNGL